MNYHFPLERDTPTPPLNPFRDAALPSFPHTINNAVDPDSTHQSAPPSLKDATMGFVDEVADACKLNDVRRDDLHSFHELIARELPDSLIRMHIYQQGLILQTLSMVESVQLDRAAVSEMVASVQKLLSGHFQITPAVKDEILYTCKRLIIQPTRVDFDFKEEAMADLRKRKDVNGLASCFENPTRTKTLRSAVGQTVSYVKNFLRMQVRDTLYGPEPCGATEATREIIKKFVGHGRQADAKDVIYMMIIRDHARRNRPLLERDHSPDEDGGTVEDAEGTRKRKRGGGRPAAGADFWTLFSKFLAAKGKEWGMDMVNSLAWRTYIEECLAAERLQFPSDMISLLPSSAGVTNEATPGGSINASMGTPVSQRLSHRSILTGGAFHNVAANHTPARSLHGLLN